MILWGFRVPQRRRDPEPPASRESAASSGPRDRILRAKTRPLCPMHLMMCPNVADVCGLPRGRWSTPARSSLPAFSPSGMACRASRATSPHTRGRTQRPAVSHAGTGDTFMPGPPSELIRCPRYPTRAERGNTRGDFRTRGTSRGSSDRPGRWMSGGFGRVFCVPPSAGHRPTAEELLLGRDTRGLPGHELHALAAPDPQAVKTHLFREALPPHRSL